MNPLGAMNRPVVAGALLGIALTLVAPSAAAQMDIRVTFPTVKDSRSRALDNAPSGDLILFTKLQGADLERAKGFRMTVTGAKDEAGNALAPSSSEAPEWEDTPNDPGLWVKRASPVREAASVTVTGTLEVYIPSLDPAAEVTVEKFYARAGKPIVSKGLKDAKVQVTVLPRDRVNEGSVVLVGPTPDMERVRSIQVVRADGTALDEVVEGQPVRRRVDDGRGLALRGHPPGRRASSSRS